MPHPTVKALIMTKKIGQNMIVVVNQELVSHPFHQPAEIALRMEDKTYLEVAIQAPPRLSQAQAAVVAVVLLYLKDSGYGINPLTMVKVNGNGPQLLFRSPTLLSLKLQDLKVVDVPLVMEAIPHFHLELVET